MSTAVSAEVQELDKEVAHWLTTLALIYLSLPVFSFLFYWLNPGAAVFFSAILFSAIGLIWKARPTQYRIPFFHFVKIIFQSNSVVFLIFLIWLSLSGTGGIGFQNSDYAASNALLKDLIDNPWPLHLREKVPIVYYFFYYLPAAHIGKWLGWEAANLFIFAWSFLGMATIWSVLSLALRLENLGLSRQCLASAIFIFFGGWDLLGALTTNNSQYLEPGAHIEWWAGIGQFSSHTTLLFWVPQHVIAPWLATSFLLLAILRNIERTAVPTIAALSFLWSPIASLGLLPFLIILAIFDGKENKWTSMSKVSSILIAPILATLGVLYYSSNAFRFPSEWQLSHPGFKSSYFLLIFLECIPLSIPFLFQHLKQKIFLTKLSLPPPLKLTIKEKVLGWTSLASLLVFPLYKMGIMNDLCMRASIPPLLVLCSFSLKVIRREFTFQYLQYAAVAFCFILGAGTAINEIIRSIQFYSVGIPPREKISSLINSPENSVIEQRAGNSSAFFWHWLGPIHRRKSDNQQ